MKNYWKLVLAVLVLVVLALIISMLVIKPRNPKLHTTVLIIGEQLASTSLSDENEFGKLNLPFKDSLSRNICFTDSLRLLYFYKDDTIKLLQQSIGITTNITSQVYFADLIQNRTRKVLNDIKLDKRLLTPSNLSFQNFDNLITPQIRNAFEEKALVLIYDDRGKNSTSASFKEFNVPVTTSMNELMKKRDSCLAVNPVVRKIVVIYNPPVYEKHGIRRIQELGIKADTISSKILDFKKCVESRPDVNQTGLLKQVSTELTNIKNLLSAISNLGPEIDEAIVDAKIQGATKAIQDFENNRYQEMVNECNRINEQPRRSIINANFQRIGLSNDVEWSPDLASKADKLSIRVTLEKDSRVIIDQTLSKGQTRFQLAHPTLDGNTVKVELIISIDRSKYVVSRYFPLTHEQFKCTPAN